MNMNCSSLVVVLMVVLGCTPAMSQPSSRALVVYNDDKNPKHPMYYILDGKRKYLSLFDTQPPTLNRTKFWTQKRSATRSPKRGFMKQTWLKGNRIEEMVNHQTYVANILTYGLRTYILNGWAVNGQMVSKDHPLIQEHLRRKLQDPTSGGSPPQNEHVQCKTFFGPVLDLNVECEVAYITGPGRISIKNHVDYNLTLHNHTLTLKVYDVSGSRVYPVKCGTEGSGTTYLEWKGGDSISSFASQNAQFEAYATTGSA